MTSEVPQLIDDALVAQMKLIKAWEDLSTRDYSRIKRKYGLLGHYLDEMTTRVDAANKAIIAERDENAEVVFGVGYQVPKNIWTLPNGWGFDVVVLDVEDEWKFITIDANLSEIGPSGGITFYTANDLGLHTVAHYPKGWYGTVVPVELPEGQGRRRKRKKLSEMNPEERADALKVLRAKIDRAESLDEQEEAAATRPVDERTKIRKDLAAGEFPSDDLGTDAGGTPIAPPQKIKDVWGKGDPPPEPTGLPATDEAHEAELNRLRAEADREFVPADGLTGPPEFSPEPGSAVTPLPTALQVNTDGSIPAKRDDNPPLPAGAQEYADQVKDEPPF
jgi:hypothetical protein